MYGLLSTTIYKEHEISQAVDSVGVSESVSEFVSDSNSEFLVFFSSWTPWIYKEGCCPH